MAGKDNLRAATGGSRALHSEADTLREAAVNQNTPKATETFEQAVVVEVLGDPTLRTEKFLNAWQGEDPEKPRIANINDLVEAPRNSLVVRPVKDGIGREDLTHTVCYPFFSSHISLPAKPGETVWVMYTTPTQKKTRAYWLSRVCDKDYVEDANFTHHDRRHDATTKNPDGERELPSIHNGGGPAPSEDNPDSLSLFPEDSYTKIRTDSLESKRFTVEPVPRVTKRPGDLVLQGSNNATIVLGTDRGFSLTTKPDGKISNADAGDKLETLRGTIDMVAGRGRYYDPKSPPADSDPKGTRARMVQNAEKDFEADKNISTHKEKGAEKLWPEGKGASVNLTADPNEGDPDFINDSSRVYITMQSDVDKNFGINLDNIPTAYDKSKSDSKLEDKDKAAAIALKSDEVRIVARKTSDKNKDAEYDDVSEINGSIRIIKEGDPQKDGACIYLLPDGTIQISGSKIMIGRVKADGGTAKSKNLKTEDGKDPGTAEPYMRYKEFTQWADGLIDALITSFQNTEAAINGNGDALNAAGGAGSSGGVTPGWGSPNGVLGGAFGMCIAPSGMSGMYLFLPDEEELKKFKSTGSPIKKIRSKRIFGE